MYTVQNKVLPGAYINFVSAARASATLGDRGTAAFPLSLDWGPENEVVTIENSEFQKGSLALTGYAYTADELRPLREIFANAKTLHLFRLNSGGAKAACKYAEAKYPGKIGNELKIVIQQNEGFTASTNEVYDVSTYLGTTLVDTQKAVKAVSDLSDNDYLHWKGSEALTENAGLLLTGGTTGAESGLTIAMRRDAATMFPKPSPAGSSSASVSALPRHAVSIWNSAARSCSETVNRRDDSQRGLSSPSTSTRSSRISKMNMHSSAYLPCFCFSNCLYCWPRSTTATQTPI